MNQSTVLHNSDVSVRTPPRAGCPIPLEELKMTFDQVLPYLRNERAKVYRFIYSDYYLFFRDGAIHCRHEKTGVEGIWEPTQEDIFAEDYYVVI